MDYKNVIERAKDIEFLNKQLSEETIVKDMREIRNCLTACRNELCLKCGYYKTNENQCRDCRWK